MDASFGSAPTLGASSSGESPASLAGLLIRLSSAAAGFDNSVEHTPAAKSPARAIARREADKEIMQWPASVTAQGQRKIDDQTSAWRGLIRIVLILEVFATWRAAWVTCQEAKDENAEKKEDDRVNGDLEGEHGDRPASDTAIILWGMTGSQPGTTPCR